MGGGRRHSIRTVRRMGKPRTLAQRKAAKFGRVMGEFYHHALHSGSKHGRRVTDVRQAKAIGRSEAARIKKR